MGLARSQSLITNHSDRSLFFSLCKGKVVPMLNKAPHHEDVWDSGGRAPYILILYARWR
jgi:hypothetical protein